MAAPVVSTILPEGIACEETAHDGRDGDKAGSEQQVEVVGKERPGIAERRSLLEDLPQSIEKVLSVSIGSEHLSPFDAPAHDVVKRPGIIYSRFSWHKK